VGIPQEKTSIIENFQPESHGIVSDSWLRYLKVYKKLLW